MSTIRRTRSGIIAMVMITASVMMTALLSTPLYAQSSIPAEVFKLVASDGATGARFGRSVDIDGDTAVIGAADDDGQGAAYVFVREGEQWIEQRKRTANRRFGTAVAIDGDTMLVGAPFFPGTAYVYTSDDGTWRLRAVLAGDSPTTSSSFGGSVALHDGTAVVGAVRDGEGSTGAVYVFTTNDDGANWTRQAKLLDGDFQFKAFGGSVAISGDTIIVGDHRNDDKDPEAGAAFVFTRSDGHWTRTAKLLPQGPYAGFIHFGSSVAIDGDVAVIGAPRDRLAQSEELTAIGIPVDLELLADTGGTWAGAAAILGASPSRTMIMDLSTLTNINIADFDNYVQPTDLAIYPDLDGNGEPELAVLGENRESWGSDKIELRVSVSGVKLSDIWLGSGWEVLQQVLASDVNGNAIPEVAVLRVPNARDKVTVVMRDIGSKQWLRTMYFDPNYLPIRMLILPDITGNEADEIVVFGQHFNGGTQKAQLKDSATGALENVIFYSRNFDGLDLVRCDDLNGNGADELAMLGRRKSDGLYRVIVKDARTGERLANVNFR